MKDAYKTFLERFENRIAKHILKRKDRKLLVGYNHTIKPHEDIAAYIEKALKKLKSNPKKILDVLQDLPKAGLQDGGLTLELMNLIKTIKYYEKVRYAWANKRIKKTDQEKETLKRFGLKLANGVPLTKDEEYELKELFKELGVPRDAKLRR